MPVYEYTCQACGKHFDYLARRVGEKPQACPACGSADLRKGFSIFAAEVKGSGGACPHASACGHVHGPGCGCCGH